MPRSCAYALTRQPTRINAMRNSLQHGSLPRRQGFTWLELRAALDDFELRGEPAREALVDVVGRMPAGGDAPELARAQELLVGHGVTQA
jgi:hypothetical protein